MFLPSKQPVVGSNPTGGVSYIKGFRVSAEAYKACFWEPHLHQPVGAGCDRGVLLAAAIPYLHSRYCSDANRLRFLNALLARGAIQKQPSSK